MERETKRIVVGGAIGIGAALAVGYGLIVRPWHLRWGATSDEIRGPMPFDDFIPHPNYFSTRAISIDAPPENVWPWLVQMGEHPRGGFYSYDWIERAMGMRVETADAILPQYQKLNRGDILDRAGTMVVRDVDAPNHLVLGPPEGHDEGAATWTIVLNRTGNRTRLVSRVRALFKSTLRSALLYAFVDPGQFIMERKWLLGVKARAEGRGRERLALRG